MRVVPLYWAVTLALALLVLAAPGVLPQVGFAWGHLVLSLLFIPHDDLVGNPFPLLPVGWTLNYARPAAIWVTALILAAILGVLLAVFAVVRH